jgi:hypothetical protein
MTKRNSSTTTSAQKWERDTTDHFTLRIDAARSVLWMLDQNVEDSISAHDRSSDEAICLSLQYATNEILQLERLSYELEQPDLANGGDLSLKLMWARALGESLGDMFSTSEWKITLGDEIFCGNLQSMARLLDEAYREAVKIHDVKFPRNPAL